MDTQLWARLETWRVKDKDDTVLRMRKRGNKCMAINMNTAPEIFECDGFYAV